jgi:ribosomal protein S18 acetylase RimI-like enzyme
MLMQINTQFLQIRLLKFDDSERLFNYCNGLSDLTKSRFSPHTFDKESIESICWNIKRDDSFRFVAIATDTEQIVGYFIAKKGGTEHDKERFLQNNIDLKTAQFCSFAPSISDDYQGLGIGKGLFEFMIDCLKEQQIHHLILLGGVKKENETAISFYQKMGFIEAGEFDREGVLSLNMWMDI